MTNSSFKPRTINDREKVVISGMLSKATTEEVPSGILTSLDQLKVIAMCECGCDSVELQCRSILEERIIADGIGLMDSGAEVGIIIWAKGDEISYLEVYQNSEENPRLPAPGTIWSSSASRPQPRRVD